VNDDLLPYICVSRNKGECPPDIAWSPSGTRRQQDGRSVPSWWMETKHIHKQPGAKLSNLTVTGSENQQK